MKNCKTYITEDRRSSSCVDDRRRYLPAVIFIGRVYVISLVLITKMFRKYLCLSSLLILFLFPKIIKTTTVYKCGTSKCYFLISVKC